MPNPIALAAAVAVVAPVPPFPIATIPVTLVAVPIKFAVNSPELELNFKLAPDLGSKFPVRALVTNKG